MRWMVVANSTNMTNCEKVPTVIAGGRKYQLTDRDEAFLDKLPISEVVCGGATGADMGGYRWAKKRGIPVKMFQADWGRHGKSAGPIRNREMARYAKMAVLFPGGRGTENMRKEALDAGITVYSLGGAKCR